MKSIIMPGNEQLFEELNNQLLNGAKEKLVTEAKVNNCKTKFTAVDMWNRQKKSHSVSDMMRRWNLN